jgi:hypothetical protein
MPDALFLHVVFLLQDSSLVSQFLCLGSKSIVLFPLNLSLTLLLALSWGVWLHQTSSEDRVKAILEQHVIADWFHLTKVATQLIFKLVIMLSLLVLPSSYLLWLRYNTNFLLGLNFCYILLGSLSDKSLLGY